MSMYRPSHSRIDQEICHCFITAVVVDLLIIEACEISVQKTGSSFKARTVRYFFAIRSKLPFYNYIKLLQMNSIGFASGPQ